MRRGGHKGVRKRFAAKTRTGCPNCRRRHIKCDEGRPTCQKCIRAGLTCEGYDSLPQPKIFQSQRDVQQQSTKSHAYFVWQSHHDADVKGAVVPKTLPTPAPQTPPALFSSPQATRAINFWLSKTRNVMVKSDVGAVFWSNLVPQAAWAFQPIQDSLNATVIVHESLDRGDDEGTFQRHKLEAAAQVNKAVRGLLESSPSPEEAMIMAAVLWTYGMVSGEYLESLLHLDHAARIARQTKKNRAGSQGIISFYLESLVNSFPKALNPRLMSILGPKLMLRHIREIQCNAVAIIRHLVMSLEQYEPLLINKGVQESYNVIATMQNIGEMAKWMMSLLLKMSKEDNSGSIECPEDGEASTPIPCKITLG